MCHPLPLPAHQKILAPQPMPLELVVEGLAGEAERLVGGFETPTLAAQLGHEDRLFDGVEALRQRALARPAAPDRKRVVEGKSVSVRVDLGGRRIIKKKKK